MIIGKIEIDLKDLNYHLNTDEQEIVHQYLSGNKEMNSIKKLIEVISDNDLRIYTDEDFTVYEVYKKCEYSPVSISQLEEFVNHKIIDPSKEELPSYYSNFIYKDGKCFDPKTKKEDIEFIPCLIEFYQNSGMTYYIFDWRYDDHVLEIED